MSRLRFTSWLLVGLLAGLTSLARADVKYQPDEIALYVGDARFWEKWDDYAFDREPCGKEGFYGYFQMGKMLVQSPDRATIGATDITRSAFYGTIGSMIEYNSFETGILGDVAHPTQDTTIGFMEKDQGWFVRWLDLYGRNQRWVRSDVGVIFNDPQGLLIGFYDLDGDGVDDSFDGDLNFGRDGGPIDAGDLVQQGVVFGTMQVHLRTHQFWTVEANHTTRLDREICGAYWEPFCGLRFLAFDESFDVEGKGGVIGNSFWNTKVENRVVGPQVGLRWFRTDGRWTFSTESRAMLAFNFETVDQNYSFGSRLSQNIGRGTDPSTAGQQFIRSRFDRFVPREGINTDHAMEIGALVELTAQSSFALTRCLSLDFGIRGMAIDGLGRPPSMINYTFPTMGINIDNNHQRVFMAGGFFGLSLNR
jgi:hypothetical protein